MKHIQPRLTLVYGCLLLLSMLLSACGGSGSGDTASASGVPRLEIADAVVAEGDNGATQLIFTVTLSEASSDDVTVDYATSDETASYGTDYNGTVASTLLINAGSMQATITITVNGDTDVENDETVRLDLSNPRNAELGDAQAFGTIANDDFPVVSLSGASVFEGDSGSIDLVFVVSLSEPAIGTVSMRYDSSNITAEAGSDYEATSGTLDIPEGTVVATVAVPVNGDLAFEADETFVLSLSNLSGNARLGAGSAFGTILTDELPSVSIAPASVNEGQSGARAMTFLVTLNAPTLGPVTVDFSTSDTGSAIAGVDYQAGGASVTINEGSTEASATVLVNGDVTPEADETFLVTLSALTGNAELDPSAVVAVGTIIDDDAPGAGTPQVRVSPGLVSEGASGAQSPMMFEVSISPIDAGAPIELQYATENVTGGAVAGVDYEAVAGATLTIPAGQASATITVQINGDDIEEADEAFNLVLAGITANAELATPVVTGLIADDDGDPVALPRLNLSHASVVEGDSGTRDMIFQLSLTRAATSDVHVDFATEDMFNPQALAGSDYQQTTQTVTIAQGETSATVAVPVFGDSVIENDEVFQVTLGNIVGDALLGNSFVFGTIVTDDPFASVRISNAGVVEGNGGDTSELTFTITLDPPSGQAVELEYVTADGSATVADNDYVAIPATPLTIPPGQTAASIKVTLIGDDVNETDEQFELRLSLLSSNAELRDATGTGTIANDDLGVGWGLPQALDPAGESGPSALPKVVMNAAGDAIVGWWTGHPNLSLRFNPTVYYTRASGWGPVEFPGYPDREQYGGRHIAIDGSGEALMLLDNDGLNTYRYAPGSGWAETSVNQSDAFDARYPDLAGSWFDPDIASNESGQAIWVGAVSSAQTGANKMVFNTYDPVTGWGLPDLVVPEDLVLSSMQLVFADNGDALMTGLWQPYVWRYDALSGAWQAAEKMTRGLGDVMSYPHMAMDAAGNAIVAWQERSDILARRYDATLAVWSDIKVVLTALSGTEARKPKVAMDGDGNAFVTWVVERNWYRDAVTGIAYWEIDIQATRYDAVDGWTDTVDTLVSSWPFEDRDTYINATQVSSYETAFPEIAADDHGHAIIVWSQDVDADGVHTVRASRYEGSVWGAPEPISDDSDGDVSQARIALDAAGNAIAVWQQLDPVDGQMKIRANRYTTP